MSNGLNPDIFLDRLQQVNKEMLEQEEATIAKKRKSTFVSYSRKKPALREALLEMGRIKNPDDLTRIEGIGPYVAERLNNIGIFNYDQISKLDVSDIRVITELIEFFPDRIERDNWVGQARSLTFYRSKL